MPRFVNGQYVDKKGKPTSPPRNKRKSMVIALETARRMGARLRQKKS